MQFQYEYRLYQSTPCIFDNGFDLILHTLLPNIHASRRCIVVAQTTFTKNDEARIKKTLKKELKY